MSFCNVQFNSVVADVAAAPLDRRELECLQRAADRAPVPADFELDGAFDPTRRLRALGLVRMRTLGDFEECVATPLLEGAVIRGRHRELGLR